MTLNQLQKKLQNLSLKKYDSCLLYCITIGLNLDSDLISVDEEDLNTLNKHVLTRDYTLNRITFKETAEKPQSEDLTQFIKEYREIFRGIKSGSMGDSTAIRAKITRWRIENPQYSLEDIKTAAQYHIDNTAPQFTRLAHYFIYKRGVNKEEISTLSATIDEAIESSSTVGHTKFL